MSRGRLFKKDQYLGIRMPSDDKARLRDLALKVRRDPSDLAWVLICQGMERLSQQMAAPSPQETACVQ
jgi:16S rRNA C1402 N4-methylase RsmH